MLFFNFWTKSYVFGTQENLHILTVLLRTQNMLKLMDKKRITISITFWISGKNNFLTDLYENTSIALYSEFANR